MDFLQLKQKLGIENGTLHTDRLTIAFDTFTDTIRDLIEYCYSNQNIVIEKAELISIDEGAKTVVISGTSDYLNVPDLKVEARLCIDDKNNVQAMLKYGLRGAAPGVNDWTFSKSFPDMPMVIDGDEYCYYNYATQEIQRTYVVLLDKLYFYNSYFIVTTQAGEEPVYKVPLKWGINFVSRLRPDGMLGIIENVFQYKNELTVYGTIRRLRQNDTPQQLYEKYENSQKPFQFPWTIEDDFPYSVPGILLKVDLVIDYSIADGKIHFTGDKLYFYNPVDANWLMPDTNPKFVPMHAYTGKVTLPEANIEMDMIAPREIGMEEFTLISQFKGLSLDNLSRLTGISGGESPLKQLPSQIQEMGDKLGQLALVSATVSINCSDIADIKVSNFGFTIGMPELKWEVWKDHFEIENIFCEFDIQYPFASKAVVSLDETDSLDEVRHIAVKVYGSLDIENVPFSVYASNQEGFTVYAQMEGQQTIPLQTVLKKYAQNITPPGDLTVNLFRLSISPGNYYSLALAMADKPNSWYLPIGPQGFTVSDVSMSLTYKQDNGEVNGSVHGELGFGDVATLYLQYDTPGDIMIRSWLEKINLKQLLKTIGTEFLPVPNDFDLDLINNSLLIREQQGNFVFQLATELEGLGMLALQVQEIDNKWGVAFGINMSGHPLQISGLSGLKGFFDLLTLDKFLLIGSSFDGSDFQFPEIASFNNPLLSSNSIPMPKGAQGVIAGFNIHATWTLNTSDKAQELLRKILGLDPSLDVTLQVGLDPIVNSRLYLKYVTKISGHHTLDCQFGFAMSQAAPEMFLLGKMDIDIQNKPCRFDVAMSLLVNGMYFAGSMEGTVAIEGVQLSNLALALGFNWEAIPSLGIAATIDTQDFDSSIAILLDSVDPKKFLLAGAISDISLYNIVNFFVREIEEAEGGNSSEEIPESLQRVLDSISLTGTEPFTIPGNLSQALDDLDIQNISAAYLQYGKVSIPSSHDAVLLVVNEKGKRWSLTDKNNNMRHYQLALNGQSIQVSQEAQLYISPAGAQMGKLIYPQGFFMTGALSVLGLKWETQIEIRKNKGIAASSSLNEPLVIFKPSFFRLSDKSAKQGPAFSLSTFTQSELDDEALHSPHLYFNGLVYLIGMECECYLKASTSGFTFEISETSSLSVPGKVLSGSVHMDTTFRGTIGSVDHINAGATVAMSMKGTINLGEINLLDGVNVDLGKVDVDLSVSGSVDMGYDGAKAYVKFNGNFDFQSSSHHFSSELDASNADIKKAGKLVLNELKDIFKHLFDTAEHWVDAVKDGLVKIEKGAEQIARVLKDGFKKADKEAMALVHAAGHDFNEIGNAFKNVYGSSAQAVGEFMSGAGANAEQIGDTLNNAFKTEAKDVAKILNGIKNVTPEDIANAMKHTFNQSAKQAAQTLQSLGKDGEVIAQALQKSFSQTAKQTADLLGQIGITPGDISKALKNVYKQSAQDAARTFQSIGKNGQVISQALQSGFNQTARQTATVLNNIGINPQEISNALKNVFNQSANDMAMTLKLLGINSAEIGSSLKNIYKQTEKSCASILDQAKVDLKDVSKVLRDAYKLSDQAVASTLNSIGKSSTQIANAMKDAFNLSANDMAKALCGAGIAANEVGGVLKDVYKLSAADAANVLKGIGKDSEYVANVLKNAYTLSAKETGNLLKSTFDLGKDGLESVMKGVGYASKDVENFTDSAFKSVKKAGKSVKDFFHL